MGMNQDCRICRPIFHSPRYQLAEVEFSFRVTQPTRFMTRVMYGTVYIHRILYQTYVA
jgi:hypothetical protein